jgi:hypothetical protein
MRADLQRLKRDMESHSSGRRRALVESLEDQGAGGQPGAAVPTWHVTPAAAAKTGVSSGPSGSAEAAASRSTEGVPFAVSSASSRAGVPALHGSWWKTSVAIVVVIAALIGGTLYWRSQQAPKLSEKDTVVLADFSNATGEPVFDETLKQALRVQLEQSPFLNVLADQTSVSPPKSRGKSANALRARPY